MDRFKNEEVIFDGCDGFIIDESRKAVIVKGDVIPDSIFYKITKESTIHTTYFFCHEDCNKYNKMYKQGWHKFVDHFGYVPINMTEEMLFDLIIRS